MRALIFGLLMSIPFLLISQDSIRITPLEECPGYENYSEEEIVYLTHRLEKYTLEITLDSLNALSNKEQVKHFQRLYLDNGSLKRDYFHPDSNKYLIPFDPMPYCFGGVQHAYYNKNYFEDKILSLLSNSENIPDFNNLKSTTAIRIWKFTSFFYKKNYMLELLIDGSRLDVKFYKFDLTEGDLPLRLSLYKEEKLSIESQDNFISVLNNSSFFEIPGALQRHMDGYSHCIEIQHRNESNFFSVYLMEEYNYLSAVNNALVYLKFIEEETGLNLEIRN